MYSIFAQRLQSQQVTSTDFSTAGEFVAFMGAIQAQHYAMAKLAIGVRLPNLTDQDIETAISNGELIRTHILRPTWHLVSPDDIRWMLSLSAGRIRTAIGSSSRGMGLTPKVFLKCNRILQKALEGNKSLTRKELVQKLKQEKIETNNLMAAHLMMNAEVEGLVCSGPMRGKEITYALLDDRVPKSNLLTRQEATAKLAKRYFTSHGPASLQDFIWWSGLTVKEAREGLENNKKFLTEKEVSGQKYWFKEYTANKTDSSGTAFFLPAFDELLISYKDRTAALPEKDQHHVFTKNGIFRPFIISKGQVAGIWKMSSAKDGIRVEAQLFDTRSKLSKHEIQMWQLRFGKYFNTKTEVFNV